MRRTVRLVGRTVTVVIAAALVVVGASAGWIAYLSSGRVHDAADIVGTTDAADIVGTADTADAPRAETVIVLGSQVRDGKPMRFLSGRLDAAVDLVRAGTVSRVLVSGDANGRSGDEIAAMTDYLVEAGVDPNTITGDPHGVDTYDTCVRAATVYGVNRALIVSQGLHVSRAVALCRDAGIDTDGVDADCDCNRLAVARNWAREWLARPKAVLDMWSGRDPAYVSSPVTTE